jgi:hypothetical protein
MDELSKWIVICTCEDPHQFESREAAVAYARDYAAEIPNTPCGIYELRGICESKISKPRIRSA